MKYLSAFRVAVGLVPGHSSSCEANLKSLVINRVQPMKPLYGIQSEVQGWPYNLLFRPGHFWGGKGTLFTVMSENENWGCPRIQWHYPMELEMELGIRSPGRLLKHGLLDSTPKVLYSVALGSELCLSDKLIGGGITALLGTAVSEVLFSLNRLGTLMLMM